MADYLDTVAPESPKTTDEAFNKPEVVDNKIQGIGDTMESVSDRARFVDDVQDSAQEIKAGVLDGAQIFRNVIYTITERFIGLGTENICLSIAKFNNEDRLSSRYAFFG